MGKPNTTWTDDEKRLLLKRYKQGETPREIARELGRTRMAVLGMVHRLRKETDGKTVPHTQLKPHMNSKDVHLRFKKHKIPTKGLPLVKRLFEIMNAQQCSIEQLSKAVGMARGTIQLWKWHNQPNIELLIACFNYLGYELRAVKMKDEDAED